MSLKAKLEAVIYAAEEPVTLNQLAALFAADAMEWKAAQEAAAAEQTAELAGLPPDAAQPLPLIEQGPPVLIDLTQAGPHEAAEPAQAGSSDSSEPAATPGTETAPAEAHITNEVISISDAEAYPPILVEGEPAAQPQEVVAAPPPADPETEAKRLTRQTDREVKSVLKQLLDELVASSQADSRGIEIREIAGGYRMATKPECHDAVRLFVKSLKPPLKLSLPALETLAVIAYKQPVTAPEVSEIRGVEAAGVLGSLLARKLIATAGRKPVIGRPILYKTTKEFLLRFGLKDVSELPSMEEFEKMAATELDMESEAAEEAGNAVQATPSEASPVGAGGDVSAKPNADAELESNSLSGEELAGTSESIEGGAEAGTPAASEPAPEAPMETTPAATTDAEGVPESQAPSDQPAPAESGTEQKIEATPHAQETEEAG